MNFRKPTAREMLVTLPPAVMLMIGAATLAKSTFDDYSSYSKSRDIVAARTATDSQRQGVGQLCVDATRDTFDDNGEFTTDRGAIENYENQCDSAIMRLDGNFEAIRQDVRMEQFYNPNVFRNALLVESSVALMAGALAAGCFVELKRKPANVPIGA